jgi:hypothetical protein
MFRRRKTAGTIDQKIDPQAILGPDLTAALVTHLGPERLAEFTETVLADARDRWSRRNEKDESGQLLLLSPKEQDAISSMAQRAGANTIESRAAFITIMMGKKVAAQAVLAGVQQFGLPEEEWEELVGKLDDRMLKLLD